MFLLQFTYPEDVAEQNVPFDVIWDTDKPIDNPFNVHGMYTFSALMPVQYV